MDQMIKRIYETGIIPVVVIEDEKNAEPLAGALCRGGLCCAEVTFRTEQAATAIRIMSKKYPQMLIGAGTILTTQQVDAAILAGAKFIVSPGLNPKIVSYCLSKQIPIIPGVNSPSDIEKALELGLKVVKFFPAEASGGLKMLKALAAPYSKLKFMPTGGINANNIASYLQFSKVIACGGSWMVASSLIEEQAFDKIEEMTCEAVSILHGFKLKHIGFNVMMKEQATSLADQLGDLLGQQVHEALDRFLVGNTFEIDRQKGEDEKGYLVFGCHSVDRVIPYLIQKGYTINENSLLSRNGQNKRLAIDERIGGFTVFFEANG